MASRQFRVVTHKNWLAEQFSGLGAVQDFGFDIDPTAASETVWWAPGAWVASALKAGVRLPLTSCGPHWLQNLPQSYTGRKVRTQPLNHVTPWDVDEVFVKLPEAKTDNFPARVHSAKYLRETLKQYHLPPETLIQLQDVVEFVTEARFFIAHDTITACSLYRHRDWIWGSDAAFPPLERLVTRKLERFVNIVLTDPHVMRPPGFVLDVGILEGGSPKVVEANAAWSSGPYDCDPAGVLKAITAAHDFDGAYPQWAWQPNPVFDKAGPLRVAVAG